MEHVTHALGIDVSKDTLELALLTPDGKLHRKNVQNNTKGFKAIVRWLGRLKAPDAHICMEASGGYEEAAALFLIEAEQRVSVVNPRRTKAYAKVHLQRSKTDRADAALIARFCQREQPARWQVPPLEQRQLRGLVRGLEALKQERERTRNRIDGTGNGVVVRSLKTVLRSIEGQIAKLEREIETHIATHPELEQQRELLCTIPGIGTLTAALVLAELGDYTRFSDARQAAAYAGLVPAHHESGSSVKHRSRLSKLGNARLRRALYYPALSAMQHNPAVNALAQRLRGRGKAKMSVVGAAMRKLLHICFGVLRTGQAFDVRLHPGT